MVCRICGSNQTKSVELDTWQLKYRGRENVIKKHKYYFCKGCGCLQIEAFPRDYGMLYDDYYNNEYSSSGNTLKDRVWQNLELFGAKGGY
ncbi:hypothetical protein [Butyrivibrio sp. INlla16]|uniref:hypothetical protein n=1 Tax=Butyrivibrio sp. INlla16 TaxID=1520807 RepID=UPI0008808DB4|nr:hypothetical protein [Butyrivibrio sp. INlla16]SDB67286.1 hypothetical protein SAMN02910263_03939 [Butyrivibrio sp. INlla16]